jgi:hypothetical protein
VNCLREFEDLMREVEELPRSTAPFVSTPPSVSSVNAAAAPALPPDYAALRERSKLVEVVRTLHQALLVEREYARPEDVEAVADDERSAAVESL